VDRYVDAPLSPDVAEGLPPAASVSRPVGYGTGVFLSPGVVESVRQSLALLRNALQAALRHILAVEQTDGCDIPSA
jgi:hypothetical protein